MPDSSEPSTSTDESFRRSILGNVQEQSESLSWQSGAQEESKVDDDDDDDDSMMERSMEGSGEKGQVHMKRIANTTTGKGGQVGETHESSPTREKPKQTIDSPSLPQDRRKSLFSFDYRLDDGRLRPPETEEEWNAFYQEYITDDTATQAEKFVIASNRTANDAQSPLSESPLTRTVPLPVDGMKESETKSTDGSSRYSAGSKQLASAFISPRPSVHRQGAASGNLRRSSDLGYGRNPRDNRNSQDMQGCTSVSEESPSQLLSPTETPISTPSLEHNQDPDIPNIEYAQHEKNRASYQSGMHVSSNEMDQEKLSNWGSAAAYQQRDLARLLGQSSAKTVNRTASPLARHSGTETETEDGGVPAPSEAAIQQAMAGLSGLGDGGEWPSREDLPDTPLSIDLEHGSETDETARPEEERTQNEGFFSKEAVDMTLNDEAGGRESSSIPKPKADIAEASGDQRIPHSEGDAAPPFEPSYRIGHIPTFTSTLSQLEEEGPGEMDTTTAANSDAHGDTHPIEISPRKALEAAHDRAVRRVGKAHHHTRHRLDSEVSEDPVRFNVTARQQSEALRLKEVWEKNGYLIAPTQSPGDARRRLKAM
ncbi:hypothetical protein QFC19_001553 [Naganishia cerealis]|uniref:Uncharacterized protein n=1 Tax=Naganishia cerealis TaxID=610337 RepID=A0ACC2WG44_9TREE|nr:hypothetical protein QFC19_001553 [Naganishia cerealis]